MPPVNSNYDYDNTYYNQGIDGFHKRSRDLIYAEFNKVTSDYKIEGIVDFGCGNGFHSLHLKSYTPLLIGVDYSDALLSSSNLPNYKEFYQRDLGQPVTIPEGNCNTAFSVEVIEHVNDYRQFLRNANGMIKPKGLLFLTTTTYWQYLFIFCIVYRRDISFKALKEFFQGLLGNEEKRTLFTLRLWDYCTGHYHGFSKKMLKKSAMDNGFTVKAIKYLFVEDIIPVAYLKQPYTKKYRFLVQPFIWLLYGMGSLCNWLLKNLRIYGSNVLLVAEKNDQL